MEPRVALDPRLERGAPLAHCGGDKDVVVGRWDDEGGRLIQYGHEGRDVVVAQNVCNVVLLEWT